MGKTIITAAVCGSTPTRAVNPAVPYTPTEIAEAAVACCRSGAAIAHIHVRDPETGAPSSDIKLFAEVMDRIHQACDMIINLTTSGLNIHGENVIERRLNPVALHPEMCSLDIGSMNFHAVPFINSPEWGRTAALRMSEYGVKPEVEVFDMGHIRQAKQLLQEGVIDEPAYFQLCLGVGWGIEATPENLLMMKNSLPTHVLWSVLGIGRMQLPMITMGILLGGHIRVGFEDNVYLKQGVLLDSNAQMIDVAVNLVQQLQGEVATPNEARQILGLAND